jgi:copper(I)-binding protein
MLIRRIALIAATVFASSLHAADIKIEDAWLRATVPGQKVAGAFMDITASRDMALIGGSTPAAASVELHFMRMHDGGMEMREMESIKLPKGETVKLAPGGLHAMLIGLKAPIKAGDPVPMTLTFRDAGGQTSLIEVALQVFTPGE